MESTSTFHILELQCRECFIYLHFNSVSVMTYVAQGSIEMRRGFSPISQGKNIAFIYLLLHKNVPYTVEL